jgi:hypothetical protein
VKIAVAIALGLGTMVGWKRIVRTVGEKIGKTHLTYAQGASAELVAMVTIGAADAFGLPVSTTHVLSSGVAGTMAANRAGLQWSTIRNLLLAWVLTLPMAIALSAACIGYSRSCSESRVMSEERGFTALKYPVPNVTRVRLSTELQAGHIHEEPTRVDDLGDRTGSRHTRHRDASNGPQ